MTRAGFLREDLCATFVSNGAGITKCYHESYVRRVPSSCQLSFMRMLAIGVHQEQVKIFTVLGRNWRSSSTRRSIEPCLRQTGLVCQVLSAQRQSIAAIEHFFFISLLAYLLINWSKIKNPLLNGISTLPQSLPMLHLYLSHLSLHILLRVTFIITLWNTVINRCSSLFSSQSPVFTLLAIVLLPPTKNYIGDMSNHG